MNTTSSANTGVAATYIYDFDGYGWCTWCEWWEGLNGRVRRHDGQRVHCEVVGELDEWEGHRDFLALCDDGELIVVSGWVLERRLLADVTPYWKNAK